MSQDNSMLKSILLLLEDNQAIDTKAIFVAEQTTITDYMIVASGRSSRHVKAIAQNVLEAMKKQGQPPLHSSGFESGDWILVDFGDCILHVMQPDSRSFYNLEGLWEK